MQLAEEWNSNEKLPELLELVNRAKKQREAVLTYFQLKSTKKPIKVDQLLEASNSSVGVLKSLVDKLLSKA